MEKNYSIRISAQTATMFHVDIDRQILLEGMTLPAQTWGIALVPGADLDTPLPCMWEGDTAITPISLADMFPAEYAYLKAKLAA